jgi:hypothetical protein
MISADQQRGVQVWRSATRAALGAQDAPTRRIPALRSLPRCSRDAGGVDDRRVRLRRP